LKSGANSGQVYDRYSCLFPEAYEAVNKLLASRVKENERRRLADRVEANERRRTDDPGQGDTVG
jgi:hypothetical protein